MRLIHFLPGRFARVLGGSTRVAAMAAMVVLVALMLGAAAPNAWAQAAPAPGDPAQPPAKGQEKPAPAPGAGQAVGTPITVEHTGEDELGARLGMALKEVFAQSTLFMVSDRDEKKIKVMLATEREFAQRPNSSSVYAIVWVYSESENTLKYYLNATTGLVHEGAVDAKAEALAAATEKLTARYSYLFD